MWIRWLFVAGACASGLVACGGAGDSEDAPASQGGAATAEGLRNVQITVSAQHSSSYEARSYPDDDSDNNDLIELYKVPVYDVFVDGENAEGIHVRRAWKGLRFMPFFNDPAAPDRDYKTLGFVNSGLRGHPRQLAPAYKRDYEVHNRISQFRGAIVVKGTFYIHAGPADLEDNGWGGAGCVEMVGNFDNFKKDILALAGSDATDIDKGMSALVSAQKLFIQYDEAEAPNLKATFTRQVKDTVHTTGRRSVTLPEREGED